MISAKLSPLMFYTQMLKTLKEKNLNITMNTGKTTPVTLSYLILLKMGLTYFHEIPSSIVATIFLFKRKK